METDQRLYMEIRFDKMTTTLISAQYARITETNIGIQDLEDSILRNCYSSLCTLNLNNGKQKTSQD